MPYGWHTIVDFSDIKTFFDPHPGFAGAAIPIPSEVKEVADELDGKSMTLSQALDMIKAVTSGVVSVLVKDGNGWIELKIEEADGTRHAFRVIRFR